MANRPSFTSVLFPIVVPVLAFFVAYFLFPSFSRDFFGVSVKGNTLGLERDVKPIDNPSQYSEVLKDEAVAEEQQNQRSQTQNNTKTDNKTTETRVIRNPEFGTPREK